MTKPEFEALLKTKNWYDIYAYELGLEVFSGQECNVYKRAGGLDFDNRDEIVYVGDAYDGDPLDVAFTTEDFMYVAHGLKWLAEILFDYVDWQSPSVDDFFDQGVDTVEEWIEYYGKDKIKDLFEVGIFDRNDFDAGDLALLN